MSARLENGDKISFTRSEARLLAFMTQRGNRLLSRDQLLDAVGGEGSEKNDRNIDFLINRLRRKLGDDARKPRFIETRYGEGYVWIRRALTDAPQTSQASIIVGPVKGLDELGDARAAALDFARATCAALKQETDGERAVIWAPDHDETGFCDARSVDMNVEIVCFTTDGRVECIVTARSKRTGTVVHAERLSLASTADGLAELSRTARNLGTAIIVREWAARVKQASENLPLPISSFDVGGAADIDAKLWKTIDVRFRALRASEADTPHTALLYACHLHAKYVVLGPHLFSSGTDTCDADETEIERLVLSTLDFAQADPNHAIAAAKLLYFVDQGYKDMAIEITERAHRAHTVACASLAAIGQMRSFTGQNASGIDCLRQAATLSPKGSRLRIYCLALLCQALMAVDDRTGLAAARQDLNAALPAAVLIFEPLFTDPDKPSLRARALVGVLSPARAKALLSHSAYVSARLFLDQAQRENALRTPMTLFQRRFGPSVVAEMVARLVPALVSR